MVFFKVLTWWVMFGDARQLGRWWRPSGNAESFLRDSGSAARLGSVDLAFIFSSGWTYINVDVMSAGMQDVEERLSLGGKTHQGKE